VPIQPYGALLVGTVAGLASTFGYFYLTPRLNAGLVHDTRNSLKTHISVELEINYKLIALSKFEINLGGANRLHGFAGFISGLAGVIVAAAATREKFNGNELYSFYPARVPSINSTDYELLNMTTSWYWRGGPGRTAAVQASYQLASLGMTIALALVGGFITGFIMRIPIIEQIEAEEMFDDEPNWCVPDDYSLKLTEVRLQQQNASGHEEELLDKRVIDTHA
jgi:ammonium transporter Rh